MNYLLILIIALSFNFTCLAQSQGWTELPNTKLRAVAPPDNFGGTNYAFRSFSQSITGAWNSAVFDTLRNRLIIWGGGHTDYYGNEIYSLDLNSSTMNRLNNPGLPLASDAQYLPGNCPEGLVNGTQANARHTYDAITYMANVDRMFVFSGARSTCGYLSSGTWAFNFSSNSWEAKDPVNGTKPSLVPGLIAVYDPNATLVFLHDNANLFSYNFSTNTYVRLTNNNTGIDYHSTAVIDPVRKKFVIVGGNQQWIYDIKAGSSYTKQTLTAPGGSAVAAYNYPGLAYSPILDKIVAWVGGNTVYILDLDLNTWTPQTFTGGPGNANQWGTFKRWNYSPALDIFVVYNSVDNNAFTLKLNAGPPPPPDTTPPSPPTNLKVSSINLIWTASTDNLGVAGYKIYQDGIEIGSTTSTAFSVQNALGSHTFSVSAYDSAGNLSTQSNINIVIQ